MSRWLDIAAQVEPTPVFSPDTQQEPSKRSRKGQDEGSSDNDTPLTMVYDGCRDSKSNEGLQPQNTDMRHGFAINGHPKTWTGNIVSPDAWRRLSEWEMHGPNGRMWDGRTKKWEDVK
jgi:hypothetical protein